MVIACGEEVPCGAPAENDDPDVEAKAEVKDEIEKRLQARAARKERKQAAAAAAAPAGEEAGGSRKRVLLMAVANDAVEEAAMLRGAATYAAHRKVACEKLADDRCKVSRPVAHENIGE